MARHVLVSTLTYKPFIGGAEIAIERIATYLRNDDIHFHVITLRYDSELSSKEKEKNITIHRVGFGKKNVQVSDNVPWYIQLQKFLFPFIAFRQARKIVRENNIESYWFMLLNTSTLLYYVLPKRHSLLSLQDGRTLLDHFKGFKKIFKPLFMRVIQRVNYVQGISRFIVEDAKKYTSRVVYIPNGVDFISETNNISVIERTRFGFNDTQKIIVTVSRLVPSRGVAELLDVLRIMPEEYVLLIVGDGYLRDSIKAIILDYNLSGRVVLYGHVPPCEIPHILGACDVFVRLSIFEGMGNAFIEALMAGVPIVGTRVGGIPDFLIEGKTGYFGDIHDCRKTKNAILRALSEKEKLVKNGKEMIKNGFTWDFVASRLKTKLLE